MAGLKVQESGPGLQWNDPPDLRLPWYRGGVLPFERLKAWQVSHQLVLDVYSATERFPVTERYGITSQSRRSAASVAANIVEGSASRSQREFRRFLVFSLRSLAEVAYWMILSRDRGLLGRSDWEVLERQRGRAAFLV
jgi:four helix bundle protein